VQEAARAASLEVRTPAPIIILLIYLGQVVRGLLRGAGALAPVIGTAVLIKWAVVGARAAERWWRCRRPRAQPALRCVRPLLSPCFACACVCVCVVCVCVC